MFCDTKKVIWTDMRSSIFLNLEYSKIYPMRKNFQYILISFAFAAIAFPLFTIFYVFPSFEKAEIENVKNESIRIAEHLSTLIVSEKNEKLKNIDEVHEDLKRYSHLFHLEKLRIFDEKGEIIFSAEKEEIGKIKTDEYFKDILLKKDVRSKLVRKGRKTLDGLTIKSDVVETYIPIVKNNALIGFFEVYHNITDRLQAINKIATKITKLSIIIIFIFLLLLSKMLYKTDIGIIETSISSLYKKRYDKVAYNILVIGASLFLAETIVTLLLHPLKITSPYLLAIIDSILLMTISSPILYFFIVRPIFSHITELKEKELEIKESNEILKDVANGIDESILLISPDYKILWANKKAIEESDCSLDEIIDNYCYKITHNLEYPCKAPDDRCPIQDILKLKEPIRYEHIHYDSHGNPYYVEVSAYPVKDEKGNITKYVHISRDITEKKKYEIERERLIKELKESLEQVKTLSGLLPICSSCKKIRNDEGYWTQLETYISQHSNAQFSHGLCPDCLRKLYPEYYDKTKKD
jgi:PAS domain S-box-containing protein